MYDIVNLFDLNKFKQKISFLLNKGEKCFRPIRKFVYVFRLNQSDCINSQSHGKTRQILRKKEVVNKAL